MNSTITPEELRADIADALFCEPEDIAPDTDLLDLGIDSVRTMDLIARWRQRGATAEFADLAENPTLSDWIERICSPTT